MQGAFGTARPGLVIRASRQFLEIGAGTEGAARAAQHRHARLLIRIELAHGLRKCGCRFAIQRVAHFGPVDDYRGHKTVALHQNFRRHRSLSSVI
ncbi:hypothetical protein D3C87_1965360 [compost metagenome]